jgi:mRNA interferase MazF
VIRGAVYRVDFGRERRGHEQRGRRFGVVVSPTSLPWNVVTVIPTSTSAQAAVFRPEVEIAGTRTRLLVDQIRSIDTRFVDDDPVDVLEAHQLVDIERALAYYLGL